MPSASRSARVGDLVEARAQRPSRLSSGTKSVRRGSKTRQDVAPRGSVVCASGENAATWDARRHRRTVFGEIARGAAAHADRHRRAHRAPIRSRSPNSPDIGSVPSNRPRSSSPSRSLSSPPRLPSFSPPSKAGRDARHAAARQRMCWTPWLPPWWTPRRNDGGTRTSRVCNTVLVAGFGRLRSVADVDRHGRVRLSKAETVRRRRAIHGPVVLATAVDVELRGTWRRFPAPAATCTASSHRTPYSA